MLKKIISATVLMGCSHAHASEWALVGTAEDGSKSYIDTSSLSKSDLDNSQIKAWIKAIFKKNTNPAVANKQGKVINYYTQNKSLMVFDCAKKKLGTIQRVGYLDDGTIHTENDYLVLSDFVPDSIGEAWLKAACSIDGVKKPIITFTNSDGTTSATYLPNK